MRAPLFPVAPLAFAALLICAAAIPARAQSPAETTPVTISLGAQPLASALNELARQTRLQMMFAPDLVSGKTAPALSGRMTPQAALQRLLQGSGLAANVSGGAVLVTRVNEGTSSLAEVRVLARTETESPVGPVHGIVARRSATATKTDTPILETSQSVSVITREEIEAQGASTVRATLRFAPGVYISDDGDNRLDSITSRGFTLDQYLDGLKTLAGTWSVTKVEPYLLERVEVLKGPSSLLYGQASPGGVLNLVSKRASADPVHEVQVRYGSHDAKEVDFDFGGALNEDGTLSGRVAGVVRDAHTEVNYTKEQRIAVAPSLTWQPDTRTKVTLLADYLHDPASGIWDLLPYNGTLLSNPNGAIDRSFYTGSPSYEHFDRTQYSVGWAAEHEFDNGLVLHQNLRMRHQDLDYQAVQGLTLQSDNRTLNRQAYAADEDLDTITIDTNVEKRFMLGSTQHRLLGGIDYQQLKWDNLTRYGTTTSLDVLNPDYSVAIAQPPIFQDAHQSQRQIGAYLQDEIALAGWRLQLGGRHDWARTTTDNHLTGTTARQNDEAYTGRVGLLHLFDNGVAPYVSYATSFQPQVGTGFDGSTFQPSKGKQTEVGVKYQPRGTDALLTASVFDLHQANVSTTDPLHTGYSVQTGEVRSRGVELAATANLTEALKVRASYSELDSKITKTNTASTLGKQQADTPDHQASVWGEYTVRGGVLTGLSASGGVRLVGTAYATTANTVQLPGYGVVDAGLRYNLGLLDPRLKGVTLALNVSNLFDKQYISLCSAVGCRYGLGRATYLSAQYHW